ncbi:potassium efflux system KefA protein [Vibrio astriarenae]|nr:potassium efflux system KefA protein [Vibrio sp. C7]
MVRVLGLLVFLVSFLASASEENTLTDIEQFASLIRWSGVMLSLLVIAATWLLLKFMNSIVESIGSQFAQYRMLLQKVQSFLQFFIYLTAALVVFMISFRINDHILALIGGTLAVSVGFALKISQPHLLPGSRL